MSTPSVLCEVKHWPARRVNGCGAQVIEDQDVPCGVFQDSGQ
ncbi:hypothetical protein [Arthrobacter rhombi]